MGEWLPRREGTRNKFSLGCIFKISPRWRLLAQDGNTALLFREEDGVRGIDWMTSVVEMTESPEAGHDDRGRWELVEKGREKSPQRE